jgi:FAD/FMN-containing dehydrogenase
MLTIFVADVARTPEEVFGVNTARLRELKAKYDPRNLFHSWHNLMKN